MQRPRCDRWVREYFVFFFKLAYAVTVIPECFVFKNIYIFHIYIFFHLYRTYLNSALMFATALQYHENGQSLNPINLRAYANMRKRICKCVCVCVYVCVRERAVCFCLCARVSVRVAVFFCACVKHHEN